MPRFEDIISRVDPRTLRVKPRTLRVDPVVRIRDIDFSDCPLYRRYPNWAPYTVHRTEPLDEGVPHPDLVE